MYKCIKAVNNCLAKKSKPLPKKRIICTYLFIFTYISLVCLTSCKVGESRLRGCSEFSAVMKYPNIHRTAKILQAFHTSPSVNRDYSVLLGLEEVPISLSFHIRVA